MPWHASLDTMDSQQLALPSLYATLDSQNLTADPDPGSSAFLAPGSVIRDWKKIRIHDKNPFSPCPSNMLFKMSDPI
jgi:hypothetical protein